MLGDIKSKKLILVKGFLFLLIGILALTAIVLMTGSLQVLALVLVAVWGFCRFYYFMFYCIEKYVDPSYRFAGLTSFLAYMLKRKRQP
jgi:hypothetical protein